MNLNKLTISEIKELLTKKEVSAKEITQSVLDAIDKTDEKVKAYLLVRN